MSCGVHQAPSHRRFPGSLARIIKILIVLSAIIYVESAILDCYRLRAHHR